MQVVLKTLWTFKFYNTVLRVNKIFTNCRTLKYVYEKLRKEIFKNNYSVTIKKTLANEKKKRVKM